MRTNLMLDKQDFIIVTKQTLDGVISEKNILFYHYALGDNDLENIKYFIKLMNGLADFSWIYGSNFLDDCFNGGGGNINKYKIKNTLLLDGDLWEGCESFWLDKDYHKSGFPHCRGDIYFMIDVRNIKWIEFINYCVPKKPLKNPQGKSYSRAGFLKIKEFLGKNKNYIVVNITLKTIYASDDILFRIALLIKALNKYDAGDFNITIEEQINLIFGSRESLEMALDFSNPVYSFNTDLLE